MKAGGGGETVRNPRIRASLIAHAIDVQLHWSEKTDSGKGRKDEGKKNSPSEKSRHSKGRIQSRVGIRIHSRVDSTGSSETVEGVE